MNHEIWQSETCERIIEADSTIAMAYLIKEDRTDFHTFARSFTQNIAHVLL